MPDVHGLFEAELRARGLAYSGPDADERYHLTSAHGELTVGLDNLARDLARAAANHAAHAGDTSDDVARACVVHFVDVLLNPFELPDWSAAQRTVFFAAEPADMDWGGVIHQRVTDSVSRVLALTDDTESYVTWLTPDNLAHWGVSVDAAMDAAGHNLDRLLADAALDVREVDGMRLAMLPINSIFKASVIFAPGFKALAERDLDWPVLAVAPCRDFLYLLPETDSALLDRMGTVVRREFHTSGYPVTIEVLRVSDDGIEAIGRYAD